MHEFHLTSTGVRIAPPYLGEAGIVVGSARLVQEARDVSHRKALERRVTDLEAQLGREARSLPPAVADVRAEHAQRRSTLAAGLEAARDELADQRERTAALRARRGH